MTEASLVGSSFLKPHQKRGSFFLYTHRSAYLQVYMKLIANLLSEPFATRPVY